MAQEIQTFLLLLAFAHSSLGQTWEAIHVEMREALATLSQEYFGSRDASLPADVPPAPNAEDGGKPHLILVGFTGGAEGRDSKASGVVVLHSRVDEHFGSDSEVRVQTYNNFRWRRAASDVLELALAARRNNPKLRQPLIVVYGHSWGGSSIRKFAGELQKEALEISLAIYIDAFQWRNPRLPDNIRYAVNFYQRAGILRGLPLRGKSKLIPASPDATRVLGNYRITPQTDFWGWSWNLIQPLLYRHHHRIAHDIRLQRYLVEIVNLKMEL
jgi:pimeloyl-ACP methyl ester carboxylesterase